MTVWPRTRVFSTHFATSSGFPTTSAVTSKPRASPVSSAVSSSNGCSDGSCNTSAPNCAAISRRTATGSDTTSVSTP